MAAKPEVVLADGENIMMYMHVTGARPDGSSYASHTGAVSAGIVWRFYRARGNAEDGSTHLAGTEDQEA